MSHQSAAVGQIRSAVSATSGCAQDGAVHQDKWGGAGGGGNRGDDRQQPQRFPTDRGVNGPEGPGQGVAGSGVHVPRHPERLHMIQQEQGK